DPGRCEAPGLVLLYKPRGEQSFSGEGQAGREGAELWTHHRSGMGGCIHLGTSGAPNPRRACPAHLASPLLLLLWASTL
ncbi:hypothetical protein NDU88_001435, partial [Pleurodeles waltl]